MIYWQNLKHHIPDAAEREFISPVGKEPSVICKCSWLEHGGRNVIFPLRSAVCSTIQIWEKFGLWDILFLFMLNDALDSLLAAFQHFHIVSLLHSRTDSFLAFLWRVSMSSTARFHRRLSNIASLSLRCAAQAQNCVCPELKAFLRPLMLNSTANRLRPRRLIAQMISYKRSLLMESEHHLGGLC